MKYLQRFRDLSGQQLYFIHLGPSSTELRPEHAEVCTREVPLMTNDVWRCDCKEQKSEMEMSQTAFFNSQIK